MGSLINEPDTDFHLKLNEQLFHIPHELVRKNVKLVHKLIERESIILKSLFLDMNKLLESNSLDQDKMALIKLNDIIKHVDSLERKLNKRVEEELKLLNRIDSRIKFFKELESAKLQKNISKLTEWYQKYTNLLIGDYLIRNSKVLSTSLNSNEIGHEDEKYWNPGVVFLRQQGLQTLLDYDILLSANRISKALTENHDLNPLIAWIGENKGFLKRSYSFLEFEARLQEYVELIKSRNFLKAIACFRNFLLQFMESNFADLKLASGLLVFIKNYEYNTMEKQSASENWDTSKKEDFSIEKSKSYLMTRNEVHEHFFRKRAYSKLSNINATENLNVHHYDNNLDFERYTDLLGEKRWTTLNDLFTKEYYSMYGISHHEPLLMYLSLGISALKTKECFDKKEVTLSGDKLLDNYVETNVLTSNCPVCSPDFAPIAKNLPYAHHTQSKLFENPVMLPNGNIYDAKKLKLLATTIRRRNLWSLDDGKVMDPIDKKIFSESDFITMYPT